MKQQFHTLLRPKVQEFSESALMLFPKYPSFEYLVNIFSDQGNEEGLRALSVLVFREIKKLPTMLSQPFYLYGTVYFCQLLYGRVDSGWIHSALRTLAGCIGAAEVLRLLNFSLIRASDVGGMLTSLGISRERMDAALSSLSHKAEPEDELAAVLWQFQKSDLDLPLETLPGHHSLWFYLWKVHREGFIKYVHPNIKQYYLPKEPSVLERFRQLVRTLWP